MGSSIKPVENWRLVLKHAWSVRFNVLAAVLNAGAIVLPLIVPAIPVAYLVTYGVATFAVIVASLLSRFVAQKKIGAQK